MRFRFVVAAIGVALIACDAAYAQEGSNPVDWFQLVQWRGDLFTRVRYQRDDEQRPNSVDTTQDDWLYEAGLELNADGYAYHPNLVEWNVNLRLGWSKQSITVDDISRDSDGLLMGYDIQTRWLQSKPVSFRAYANQSQDFVDRSFARAIELNTQRQGVEMTIRSDWPVTILLEHSQIDQDTGVRIDDERTLFGSIRVEDRRDPDFFNVVTLEWEDVSESSQSVSPDGSLGPEGNLSTDRIELIASNNWIFGAEPTEHQLVGTARAMRRRGFFENDVLSLAERLDLSHTPTFGSFYNGIFTLNETTEQRDRLLEAEAGVRKMFYDSLELRGWGVFRDREFEDGNERAYGAEFEADYRKITPIGLYTASLDAGREWQSEQSPAGTRRVLDEPVTFAGLGGERLSQANALGGTITVTDLANTRVFVEGLDYTVRSLGSFIELEIVPAGDIAVGDTVLVDYTIAVARDADFTADRFAFFHRLDFDQWPVSVYFEYRIFNESLNSGTDPGTLNRDEIIMFGTEWRPLEQLRLIGEYEIQNHRLSPSWHAWRARANYDRPLGDNANLSLGAQWEMLVYEDAADFGFAPDEDHQDTIGGFARYTTRLNRIALVRVEADVFDTQGRDNDFVARLGAGVDVQFRDLTIALEGYHRIYSQEGLDGVEDYVSLTVRRRF